jgi:hypothetical protein
LRGLGGAAGCTLATHAQQPERMRRIGVLMVGDETDPMPFPHIPQGDIIL